MPQPLTRTLCLTFLGGLMLVSCSPDDIIAIADPTKNESASEEKPKPKHAANRLAKESSPYLLLHAHNPVNWYPWGPEAFATAKKENKPIFLSIGYSSCFWCHVMERKVFENEDIAKYMNEHFINIKVDREERPDVDDIYMTALIHYFQAIRSPQGGGWPLSIFLTPEGKPFVGGTYFPPKSENGRLGFPTVLKRVHEGWAKQEKEMRRFADLLTGSVKQSMKPRPVLRVVKIERPMVAGAVSALLESHDEKYGGVDYREGAGNPSKFPVPAKLELLHHAAAKGDTAADKALTQTLAAIANGGIRDHVGGGFHRYSTDRRWHVPHFEKMLYDNAQLAELYALEFQRTGKQSYKDVVEGIFRFVKREMTDLKGGFYSALDAETDGKEGEHYVWTKKEVQKILGKDDAAIYMSVYGMDEPQVFEHGYVLHLPKATADVAKARKTPLPELKVRLSRMHAKLLAARQKRKPLLRDDKVLTSWNGLMIRALANAGRILKRPEYVKAAEKGALFVLAEMRDEKKRLMRTWRKGKAKLNAYVDDYAFLVSGLLALHEATGDDKWLNAARRLTDDQIRDYWSKVGGGFFFTPEHHEELIARTRNAYDAVLPSGNSVSVRNLVKLAKLTGEKKYREHARDTIRAFASSLENTPRGMAHFTLAVAEYIDSSDEKGDAKSTKQGAANSGTGSDIRPISDEKPGLKSNEKISAQAYLSVDKLPVGGQCRIVVFVTVQKDWHINQNPPQPKNMIPTVLSIRSPNGVKLTDVKYPKGHNFKLEGFDEELLVYEGKVAIYGTLEIPSDIKADVKADEMEIRVRYQACSSSRCLPPKVARLKGKIPLAQPGATVKQINEQFFKKKKEN